MSHDPRLRPDASAATSSWKDAPESQLPASPPLGPERDLTDVARTLAAYGGGAVAFQLALDLVLNEVVEQARSATGATGAAVALARDGSMECRATTGESAPDLGMRVDSDAGLSGACLRSGEMQHCTDTELDPRVNAEACRQLRVRSMLIIPVADGKGPFGILEVFSSIPDAFHEHDVQALRVLAKRIVASKREAEDGGNRSSASVEEEPLIAPLAEPPTVSPVQDTKERSIKRAEPIARAVENEPEPSRRGDLLTTVLAVLVIAVAIVLGILIGWRGAAKRSIVHSLARLRAETAPARVAERQNSAPVPRPVSANPTSAENISSAQTKKGTGSEPATPAAGGLVVTQNGKVIYRGSPSTQPVSGDSARESTQGTGRLIRRVEPEYPTDAKAQSIQGPVILDVQVRPDGVVGNIGIVSGNPLLAQAAVHAVRQWKYQPEFVNGRPVEAQTRVTVNFSLPPAN